MELFECSALERDLRVLAADLDALKNATAGQIDNAVLDLQDRVRRILTDIRGTARSARYCAGHTLAVAEDYLRNNPWQIVGIACAAGLLIGVLSGARRTNPERHLRTSEPY